MKEEMINNIQEEKDQISFNLKTQDINQQECRMFNNDHSVSSDKLAADLIR